MALLGLSGFFTYLVLRPLATSFMCPHFGHFIWTTPTSTLWFISRWLQLSHLFSSSRCFSATLSRLWSSLVCSAGCLVSLMAIKLRPIIGTGGRLLLETYPHLVENLSGSSRTGPRIGAILRGPGSPSPPGGSPRVSRLSVLSGPGTSPGSARGRCWCSG